VAATTPRADAPAVGLGSTAVAAVLAPAAAYFVAAEKCSGVDPVGARGEATAATGGVAAANSPWPSAVVAETRGSSTSIPEASLAGMVDASNIPDYRRYLPWTANLAGGGAGRPPGGEGTADRGCFAAARSPAVGGSLVADATVFVGNTAAACGSSAAVLASDAEYMAETASDAIKPVYSTTVAGPRPKGRREIGERHGGDYLKRWTTGSPHQLTQTGPRPPLRGLAHQSCRSATCAGSKRARLAFPPCCTQYPGPVTPPRAGARSSAVRRQAPPAPPATAGRRAPGRRRPEGSGRQPEWGPACSTPAALTGPSAAAARPAPGGINGVDLPRSFTE